MSLPNTPLQSSAKSKRRSKGGNDSPISRKPDGTRWVPLPGASHCKIPSHRRNFPSPLCQQERVNYMVASLGVDVAVVETVCGGVVDTRGPVLFGSWVQLESLTIGNHVPAGRDGVLLHPETMKAIVAPIASHLVVRVGWRKEELAETTGDETRRDTMQVGSQRESAYVCCKVWPCASLPLDVVALGWSAVLGCGIQEGEGVEVWPLRTPTTNIPVASSVALTPIESSTLPWNRTFSNYLLYSHEGHLVTRHSCVGVSSYLGERRVFKVADITATQDPVESSSSSITDIEKDLRELTLSESSSVIDGPRDCKFSKPIFAVYKITGSTRLSNRARKSRVRSLPGSSEGLSLSGMGGAREQKELLRKLILHPLSAHEHRENMEFPHGVLMYGPPGVGKSRLAQALVKSTSAHVQMLSARLLLTQDGEEDLRLAFSTARDNCPALIVLDDLDVLSPQREAPPSDSQLKVLARLSACMDSLHRDPPPDHVAVVATTHQLERVEPSLRVPGRFDKEVEIPVPTARDRREILGILLSLRSHMLSDDQLKSVADRAHGYVGADLNTVCAEAQYKALCRRLDDEGSEVDRVHGENSKGVCRTPAKGVEMESVEREQSKDEMTVGLDDEGGVERASVEREQSKDEIAITLQDMLSALKEVRPSAMKEVILEVPKVLWSDVGGNKEVKQSMEEAVEWPLKHPEVFERLGIRPPRGVLLYGPPGCSKTMVARALATQSGLNFMAVKGPELFSKWVGDSEKAVRQVFRRARSAAPAIIFFDEIDALAVQRKGEGSSVGDRVLAQLLTEMDGVESSGDVLVVAATNRPDMIDKALLRPGRIDRLIYVPLPSSSARKEIFEIQFRKLPTGDGVDVDQLVHRTAGYSGAEIVSLCQRAALCAMHEDMKTPKVNQDHFDSALLSVLPQTDQDSLAFYERFKTKTM